MLERVESQGNSKGNKYSELRATSDFESQKGDANEVCDEK